jgi:predicted transcriptional regulator of viral defense system
MKNRNATDLLLGKMALDGEIDRVGRGQYTLPQTHRTDRTDPDATSVRH